MSAVRRPIAATLAALSLTAAAARPISSSMHNRLVRAEPAASAEVTAAPKAVRLWFTQKPDPGLSSVTVVGPDSVAVATGKAAALPDAKGLAVPGKGAMAPGRYEVRWKTASADGHVIRGSYSFLLKP